MNGSRNLYAWSLVGLVGVVTAGAAALGITQAPTTAALQPAITNTLRAASYSEVFTATSNSGTAVGTETGYLTYQAPDRLGGYVEISQNQRSYIYVLGSYEYQSITVTNRASASTLVFYRQPITQSLAHTDPAMQYLRYGRLGHQTGHSGDTYTRVLTRGGETGTLTYTVSGQYVGHVTVQAPGTTLAVTISQIGTASPVNLPKGARIVGTTPGISGGTATAP